MRKKERLAFAIEHILACQPNAWIVERVAEQIARARNREQRVWDQFTAQAEINQAWDKIEARRVKFKKSLEKMQPTN